MDNYNITIENLTGGEKVALGILEVTSIPHFLIIDNKAVSSAEITNKYKADFGGLLNEIHQVYRTENISFGIPKDISVELLWKTTAVVNQPYNANIGLFIVVRTIDKDAHNAKERAKKVLELFSSTIAMQKYDFKSVEYTKFKNTISDINDLSINAVVKEEKAENLQNQILPYCYSYDKIPTSDDDLSKIVNILTEYPNCAVSMQLIPTMYNENEAAEIDRTAQILDTLSKGVSDRSMGNISFALAEKHANIYRYYSNCKTKPLFTYNILIFGDYNSCNNIASRVYGQLSLGEDDTASFKIVNLNNKGVAKDNNFYPLPWAVNEILQEKDRNTRIWNTGQFSESLYRISYVITSEEAAEFFRLPIGNERISAGLNINESGKGNKTYASDIINAGDITVGKLRSSSKGDTIGFSLKDLAKHMLIVGTPGSGKTTFSVSLLDRLWKDSNIPFLVIEPAKNEYRALVQSIPDLQVFTPGKNFISPFVFNPFVPPKNVKLETYKSTLKTAFSAAVSMSTPLDKIFEEAINNCYSDFRWLDTYTSDDKGKTFNISDFIKCFQQTFDEIGYTGDAKNIGRAGVVRLNSLVNLFDNYFSIPIEDILKKPTVIELAAIENSDQKALIIALLLLSVLAYVNANFIGEGGLKNVILLEEAHVLLDADSNAGQGEANPSAVAQGLVKRMLAEIRSYGVGIIIADQSPRKVSTDVVALTDMKMVFRLVESDDKQIIGNSTNMTESQIQRMSKLKPGEAFLFFNKLDEPEEVITPDYRLENKISITLSDKNISELSTYWNDKKVLLKPYPQCMFCDCCKQTCDYNCRILAAEIARRIFIKNFKPNSSDIRIVKKVFSNLKNYILPELNDEPYTHCLFMCTSVHLWRKIKYGTKIKVPDKLIENSINKYGGVNNG